jgi:NAD(P)-dependent dehydrogenase (short-subunit alcohol dehydrogenase family)
MGSMALGIGPPFVAAMGQSVGSPSMTISDGASGPLAGQSALITGGGSGIGLACARRLVADGASVTLAGRTLARVEGAAADLRAGAPEGVSVAVATADVAIEDQVRDAVAVAVANGPAGLDLVVAAAGRGGLGPIITTPLEEWEAILGSNLTGTFLTFKHAGAALARSGGGSMVAISSIAGTATHRFMSPYSVSKAAIDMLVRGLADELGVAGVRVNSVRPGLVETELVEAVLGDEGVLADYLDQMALRRVGQPADVAALVRFLLGPESSWITGENVSVDGGHHLRRGPNFEPAALAFFGDAARGVPPDEL